MARDHDGFFIVLEGIDGSGTTTQCQRYAAHLREKKRLVHITREPSDGPIGTLLRLGLAGRVHLGASFQAQTMALLFAADRLDHVGHEVTPHLRDGAVVISDRYDLSSIAYQSATADEDDVEFAEWVRGLNRYAPRPDAIVVLDVDPDEAERRRAARLDALELYEETQLQKKLAALYRRAGELVPGDNVIVVDGNADAETVTRAIVDGLASIVE